MDHTFSTMTRPNPVAPWTASARRWQRTYSAVLLAADAAAVSVALLVSQAVWVGLTRAEVVGTPVTYPVVSALLCIAWVGILGLFGTRAERVAGGGVVEYRLVVAASLQLFGAVAIVNYLWATELSRGYFLFSLPTGVVLLLGGRAAARTWLHAQRRRGRMTSRVLIVGDRAESARVAEELRRQPSSGLRVVGMHVTSVPADGARGWTDDDAARLLVSLDSVRADTVLVAGGSALDAQQIRRIGWSLEPGRQHLVVAVALTDIAGPRIHTRPVAGLPLVHVETPRYTRRQIVLKRGLDILGAAGLLLLLAPLLLVTAALVRASGPGPVLYRQQRVGQHGVPFDMLKFRSMVVDADARLGELLAAQGGGDRPLFKVADDPRITPLGRVLRKYSLDELPQLWNVLRGRMSLVGPRPQRAAEVAFYDDAARRRLILRPGMSGLWQVSGRSSLSWDDAIRLDLFYVENWSLVGDLLILLRTFRAVLAPGASAH